MVSNKDSSFHRPTPIGIGLVNYPLPKELYVPSLHNPTRPVREGALDAFYHPSLDVGGERVDYWGNK